jgi:hypothetical protein
MTKTTTKSTVSNARPSKKAATPGVEPGPGIRTTPGETKIGTVIRQLGQAGGASLDELVAATGWQPHTTRAAITGLRKKGHTIAKAKVGGATRYSIAPATAA